ncbi:class IV adenylate cyclase [Sulfurisphaera javensis]|uniref:Class IV adenylate cyclase n=1 Tax=Sulfurisphaera javensis TaxID=2049879 RepID=A0AAT9GRC8_9CREN
MSHIEREIKIKLISPKLEDIERKLNEKYKPINEEYQVDIYYNSPVRDFRKTDEALRLRVINNNMIELTYKGPKLSQQSKSREEIIVKVDNLNSMDLILQRLGFIKTLKIEKIRKNYKIDKFIVSLDKVTDLGEFIEIEGINVKEEELTQFVNTFLKEFNILGEKTLKSYLELLIDKLEKTPNSNTY